MTLDHLRIRDLELVVALHEEGNMTQAAKRLGITEPAFSKQLQKIERRIQARLFERGRGGVVPTAPGRSFVAHATNSIQAFHRAVHDAHEARYGEHQILRIGASSFLSPTWIQHLCAVELRQFREPTIEVITGYSPDLVLQLQQHHIDLALITSPPPNAALTTVRVATNPFMMVMRSEHHLAHRKSVSLIEVAQYPWVLFNRAIHPYLYDRILQRMAAEHWEPRLLHHIGQAEHAAALLTDDKLIAWMTPAGAERVAHDGLVRVPLVDSVIQLETHLATLATNKSQLVSEYVRMFVKRIEEQKVPTQLRLLLG
jgi:DNA-binding transcriptional LysR family regulator